MSAKFQYWLRCAPTDYDWSTIAFSFGHLDAKDVPQLRCDATLFQYNFGDYLGRISPLFSVRSAQKELLAPFDVPDSLTYAWAYPCSVTAAPEDQTAKAALRVNLCKFGGFVFFADEEGAKVVAAKPVTNVDSSDTLQPPADEVKLEFDGPLPAGAGLISYLTELKRFQPVTFDVLTEIGINGFAWLGPGEYTIQARHGAFVYHYADTGKSRLFALSAKRLDPGWARPYTTNEPVSELFVYDGVRLPLSQVDMTVLQLKFHEGWYASNSPLLLRMKEKLKFGTNESASVSRRGPVTIPPEKREKLGIPEHAKSFVFAHPLAVMPAEWNDVVPPKSQAELSSAEMVFLYCGGFVYFSDDSDLNPVGICAVGFKSSLGDCRLSGPNRLSTAERHVLDEMRMGPVTIGKMLRCGARQFAWVPPHWDHLWTPHGAFVYRYSNEADNRYFTCYEPETLWRTESGEELMPAFCRELERAIRCRPSYRLREWADPNDGTPPCWKVFGTVRFRIGGDHQLVRFVSGRWVVEKISRQPCDTKQRIHIQVEEEEATVAWFQRLDPLPVDIRQQWPQVFEDTDLGISVLHNSAAGSYVVATNYAGAMYCVAETRSTIDLQSCIADLQILCQSNTERLTAELGCQLWRARWRDIVSSEESVAQAALEAAELSVIKGSPSTAITLLTAMRQARHFSEINPIGRGWLYSCALEHFQNGGPPLDLDRFAKEPEADKRAIAVLRALQDAHAATTAEDLQKTATESRPAITPGENNWKEMGLGKLFAMCQSNVYNSFHVYTASRELRSTEEKIALAIAFCCIIEALVDQDEVNPPSCIHSVELVPWHSPGTLHRLVQAICRISLPSNPTGSPHSAPSSPTPKVPSPKPPGQEGIRPPPPPPPPPPISRGPPPPPPPPFGRGPPPPPPGVLPGRGPPPSAAMQLRGTLLAEELRDHATGKIKCVGFTLGKAIPLRGEKTFHTDQCVEKSPWYTDGLHDLTRKTIDALVADSEFREALTKAYTVVEREKRKEAPREQQSCLLGAKQQAVVLALRKAGPRAVDAIYSMDDSLFTEGGKGVSGAVSILKNLFITEAGTETEIAQLLRELPKKTTAETVALMDRDNQAIYQLCLIPRLDQRLYCWVAVQSQLRAYPDGAPASPLQTTCNECNTLLSTLTMAVQTVTCWPAPLKSILALLLGAVHVTAAAKGESSLATVVPWSALATLSPYREVIRQLARFLARNGDASTLYFHKQLPGFDALLKKNVEELFKSIDEAEKYVVDLRNRIRVLSEHDTANWGCPEQEPSRESNPEAYLARAYSRLSAVASPYIEEELGKIRYKQGLLKQATITFEETAGVAQKITALQAIQFLIVFINEYWLVALREPECARIRPPVSAEAVSGLSQ